MILRMNRNHLQVYVRIVYNLKPGINELAFSNGQLSFILYRIAYCSYFVLYIRLIIAIIEYEWESIENQAILSEKFNFRKIIVIVSSALIVVGFFLLLAALISCIAVRCSGG